MSFHNKPSKKDSKKQESGIEQIPINNAANSFPIKEWYVYLLVFIFTFILYSNTFHHQWALDDGAVFNENVYVKQGSEGYGKILTTYSMHGVKINPEAYQYRPLSLLMFATEWEISPDNPTLYHVLNVLWYALACVLLFIVLRKMFVEKNKLLPFIITILYASHPMHTEVVANIKGRDEILLLLFILSGIWFTLHYIDKKKSVFLAGIFISFLLAMFSKESAITFLAAIPLTVYFFRKAERKDYIYIMTAISIPVIIYLIARFAVLSDYTSSELSTINNYFAEQTLLTRWACAIMLLGKYLLLLIFPYQQVCDYSLNQLPLVGFGSWQTLLSLLIYVALIIYAIRSLRKKSPVAYGIFFFIITMSIYSNLVYLIGASFADRFLFIPSLGYCMAIVYLLYQYADKKSTQQASYITPSRLISGGLLIIMLLFFTVKTYTRSAEWENNFTLYGADIKKSENSARLNFLWGEALRDKAIEYQNKNNTPSPSAVLEKNSLMYRAYLWKSILAVKKGIAIYPKHANAYDRVGFAFYSLHPYYSNEGFLDSAVYYYSRALQLNPKSIITQYNIAIAYYNKGDYENAKNHYLYVVQSDTSEHVVRFDLGSTYAMLGKLDSARYHFTLYLQKHPEGAASCYSNLAIGYARINQLDSAIAMSKNTLNADPYNVSTYQLLSQIYSFRKQSDSAMLTINTLIALMPDNPTGYIEKGNLFRQINQADSANYYYMLGKSKQP